MNRISISCACLALLVLSSPGVAQSARDSLPPAKRGPLIVPSVSAALVQAGYQPDGRLAPAAVPVESTARRDIVAGGATGLALAAIGLTVRDLARSDWRSRNFGTDAAIVVSAGLVGALANYVVHARRSP